MKINLDSIVQLEDMAEKLRDIARELSGKKQGGLRVGMYHNPDPDAEDLVVIDDGQCSWITSQDDYVYAAESLIDSLIGGGNIDEWYSEFCDRCEQIWSNCGGEPDTELHEAVDGHPHKSQILEALGVQLEENE